MKRKTRYLLATATALSLLSVWVIAKPPSGGAALIEVLERHGADRAPDAAQRRLSKSPRTSVATEAVTVEDVGDVHSFGRNVKWLGLADLQIEFSSDSCPTPPVPEAPCVVLSAPPATTVFEFNDLGHVTLPPRATNSLLCYWWSPIIDMTYFNPGTDPAVGRFVYSPTLTVENPVLDDPTLIDPTTGLPFGGSLLTGMTSSERFEVPLSPGMELSERQRDSAVCIAGFLGKRALMETYGLTEAQSNEFFRQSTTVRLNMRGNLRYARSGSVYAGLRIVGD